MSQVTEQSVRFQTALASIKLIQASAVLDLTEDDFDFLTSNKVWIATDRSRARRCVEACVYGTLDFVGYPRFPAPVEFIAAVIAYYVHPVNIQTACLIDRKSGSAGMPRPISYAVFCLKKKNCTLMIVWRRCDWRRRSARFSSRNLASEARPSIVASEPTLAP